VLATGLATEVAGLSMAFGAFLAGLLLAETTYRLQVFAAIQPFRGFLLGLFFMTVGMAIDLEVARSEFVFVVVLLGGLMLLKAGVLVALSRTFGQSWPQAVSLGLLLAQGGEFAFVLFAVGVESGAMPPRLAQVLTVVVILSMMLTPLMAALGKRLGRRMRTLASAPAGPEPEQGRSGHVIIAGYGRAGKAIARHLSVEGVPFVIVDFDIERVAAARQRGEPLVYGDASRPEVLEALDVDRARSVIVAFNDRAATVRLVSLLRYVFPELKIFARARDEAHGEDLIKAGADGVVPELYDSALKPAGAALKVAPPADAERPSPA